MTRIRCRCSRPTQKSSLPTSLRLRIRCPRRSPVGLWPPQNNKNIVGRGKGYQVGSPIVIASLRMCHPAVSVHAPVHPVLPRHACLLAYWWPSTVCTRLAGYVCHSKPAPSMLILILIRGGYYHPSRLGGHLICRIPPIYDVVARVRDSLAIEPSHCSHVVGEVNPVGLASQVGVAGGGPPGPDVCKVCSAIFHQDSNGAACRASIP